MARPIKINLDIVKGDLGEFKFNIKTKKNRRKVPVDLRDYDKIQMGIQTKNELYIINVDKNDTINNDLEKGLIYFQIPISITKKFVPGESHEYDVQLMKGDTFRKTIIKGLLNVIDEINTL